MEFNNFLSVVLPIFILELVAAIIGTIYIKRRSDDKTAKYFVLLLWLTVVFELMGTYAPLAYFTEYRYFNFVKDTLIVRNCWMVNIHFIISYFLYIYYFKMQLVIPRQKQILNVLLVTFIVSSVVNLFTSDVFFVAFSAYTNITGALILLLSIAFYFFNIVRSDEVLKIGKLLPSYIAFGAVILHLCLIPFFIYSNYLRESVGQEFVDIYLFVLRITNLLVYSVYITGFIVCRKKKFIY